MTHAKSEFAIRKGGARGTEEIQLVLVLHTDRSEQETRTSQALQTGAFVIPTRQQYLDFPITNYLQLTS